MKIDKQTTKEEPMTLQQLLYAAIISSIDFTRDFRRPETIYKECWQKAVEAARIARNEK